MPKKTQIKQKLLIVLLATSILSQSAKADCQDLINKCDAALEARKTELQLSNLALMQSMERSAMLEVELEHKEAKLRSFTRNPFIMSALGLVVGIVVTGYALKK